jgi:hypothetical protein
MEPVLVPVKSLSTIAVVLNGDNEADAPLRFAASSERDPE